tara:strand:+ start:272 stop:676 length:405 start_codon:yes stop_codon:yes gene_type:complete
MSSFTKNIFNKPNIAKPIFKKKRSMNGKAQIKEEDYYIYQYQIYGAAALFYRCAGGVGGKIYEYLKFKDNLNGREFRILPNNLFMKHWKIRRQRINDALQKLEAEDLVVVLRQKGFCNRVKLNIPEVKNEKENT